MIPQPPGGFTVPHATIDFETKSEAGFFWNEALGKWEGPPGAASNRKGLSVVGSARYAAHPTADILTLSYQVPTYPGLEFRWRPGMPLPVDLFAWIAAGGRVEAHNVMFERLIWFFVAGPKYGFP